MTLLEITIAITLMATGMVVSSKSIVSSMVATETARETTAATQAARSIVETLRATQFSDVFATFNADAADDPGGAGTAPGSGHVVPGLDPQQGDPDGLALEIRFPAAAGAPGVLREDIVDPALGMPRDLNGDGVMDAVDHSGDFQILPVVVRIQWTGAIGSSQMEFKTILTDI